MMHRDAGINHSMVLGDEVMNSAVVRAFSSLPAVDPWFLSHDLNTCTPSSVQDSFPAVQRAILPSPEPPDPGVLLQNERRNRCVSSSPTMTIGAGRLPSVPPKMPRILFYAWTESPYSFLEPSCTRRLMACCFNLTVPWIRMGHN